MSERAQTAADGSSPPPQAELEKEIRTLRRKLERADRTRAYAESMREQNDRLLRSVIGDLRATQDALERTKDELEERVAERTQALRAANEQLQRQLAERDRLNAELAAARDAAIAANNAKSAFLATMSHELRTPLNVVLGYAELVREVAVEEGLPRITADIDNIHGAAAHLLSIINDILDLAKIESGAIRPSFDEVSVEPLVRELAATMRPLVHHGGNELTVAVAPRVGVIATDRLKLRQILFNLLSNAAKFTANGEIRVDVRGDADGVTIAVRDSGIGIPAAELNTIFEPFTQVDASNTQAHGGTGLGLAICRRFAEALGASLSVTSVEGEGST
ncbi:MAG: hypothetical protein KC486_04455, partial [Myxococcales bacterium]|nr:hypothetical protein [Myxococcales bacterium]